MSINLLGTVGGNNPASAGSNPVSIRQGASGEVNVSDVHGRYYEATVRGKRFGGANLAGVTTSAAFATAYTGLCLVNPIGSLVNLVVDKLAWAELVANTSALVLGIMTGFNAATQVVQSTVVVTKSMLAGQPAGVGVLLSSATLPTAPTNIILLDTIVTGAITTSAQGGKTVDREGAIVIPPGGYAAFYTSAASVGSSLVFGFEWEEVPVTI